MSVTRCAHLLFTLPLMGCFSPARASSGKIGCDEEQIQISDESIDLSSHTWVATCHGKRFQCVSIQTGSSCTRMDDEQTSAGSGATSSSKPKASWTLIKKSGYAFEKPDSWSSDGTSSYRSSDDEHAVHFSRFKLKATFDEFVEEQFTDYEVVPMVKGETGAIIASTVQGLGSVTSAAIENDGAALVLTCEDFSEKKTSSVCTKVLRSFRVEKE